MYKIKYTEHFLEDLEIHQKTGTKSILIKINDLIDELREHPTLGTGKPQQLKGDRKGEWSRRINQKHRLIYEIHDDVVTVLLVSAYGHYGDK